MCESYKNDMTPLKCHLIKQGYMTEDMSIILLMKDCVLLEYSNGKTYGYRVLNYLIGASRYLCHKNKPVRDEMLIRMASRVRETEVFDVCYPKGKTALIRFIFQVVFVCYGYKIRKEQVELAVEMFLSMAAREVALSDVPVGLGKTHAYLVAAIVYSLQEEPRRYVAEPVIVTTSSIELQRAIINEYLPEISKMLLAFRIIDQPITSVLRKGKGNYLCTLRLEDYLRNLDGKKKHVEELIVLRQLQRSNVIDLDEVQGISAYDRRRICVNAGVCKACNRKIGCEYQHFMKKAKRPIAAFQVCNHNYYLADVIRRKQRLAYLLPNHRVTIFDEAHKLYDAAVQMYGTVIDQKEILSLIRQIRSREVNRKDERSLTELVLGCEQVCGSLFARLIEAVVLDENTDDVDKYRTELSQSCIGDIKRLSNYFTRLTKLVRGMDLVAVSELHRIGRELEVFVNGDIIFWLENPFKEGCCRLVSIPVKLSEQISRDLWQMNKSKILTSGTLAVDDDFKFISRRLGIHNLPMSQVAYVRKETPFDYTDQCLLYISDDLPYPDLNSNKYIEQTALKIHQLLILSNGHALVLFTSYKMMKQVFELLSKMTVGHNITMLLKGRQDLIQGYKRKHNGVLFAAGSAWEGINIPGDLLSHLIVVKLPFPSPDPISEHEKELYQNHGAYMDNVLITEMLMKLRQGTGRLIRSETDTGVISILDVRASKKGKYHDAVINALPDCRSAENAEEIRGFLEEKKEVGYWGS